jgi:putative redox protein
MTEPTSIQADPPSQAVVSGDLSGEGGLTGRAGAADFRVGGPDGRGGSSVGANPYDLLSASLAACTAMTIRLHAQRKGYPLAHVEVAVSYRHAPEGGRNAFERSITLEGSLDDDQRVRLMQAANSCPVGQTLGIGADINTREGGPRPAEDRAASYDDDLGALSIPNIDAD